MSMNIAIWVREFKFTASNVDPGMIFPCIAHEKTRIAIEENNSELWAILIVLLRDYREWYDAIEVTERISHIKEYGDSCTNFPLEIFTKGLENDKVEEDIKIDIREYLCGNLPQPRNDDVVEKTKKQKGGWIYILETPSKEYKIGLTTLYPTKRLAQISPQLPYKVNLLMTIKSEDVVVDETRLHEYFKDKRLNGEWFNLDDEDLAYVRSKEWQLK